MFDEIKMKSVDCIITNEYKFQTYIESILLDADEKNKYNSHKKPLRIIKQFTVNVIP